MGRISLWSEDRIVQFVWDYRLAEGVCTLGSLIRATGLSRTAVHERVKKLEKKGRLMLDNTYGSLRATDERLLREIEDGILVDDRTGARYDRRRPAGG